MKKTTKRLARAGMTAALYVVLSLITLPVASGAIQFRVSEGLTLLPLLFPEAPYALFVGCALSNLITGCALFDVVFGSVITLLAGVLTYFTGKIIKKTLPSIVVGGLFPVVLNALLLPAVWYYCYGQLEYVYYLQACFLLISQGLSVYLFGSVICVSVKKFRNDGADFLS